MGFKSSRLRPRHDLPITHVQSWGLDLANDQKAAVILNIAAFPLFAAFGWVFLTLASGLRSQIATRVYLGSITPNPFLFLLLFIAFIVVLMVIHEAIHGIFFWIFTRSRPVFGLKLLFAYAGAPEWYIPRNQYAIIGLAPLVLMTVGGFLVVSLAPLSVGQLALIGITLNASGAVGDLYVSGKVMCQPRNVLVQDTGARFTMFREIDDGAGSLEHNQEGVRDHER